MKVIAFYLPQFHQIPENDEWWGEGFTEWTKVRAAEPLFAQHNQPRIPANDDYYDLSDVDVMRRQVALAAEHGLYGFCFYHYWFSGKPLLEKPIQQFLETPDLNLPFCISWPNGAWTRTWASAEHEVLIEQEYGAIADWEEHFQFLLPFFSDPRYILVDGLPLFILYSPESVPVLNEMLDYFSRRAQENGLGGLTFAYQGKYFHELRRKDDSRFAYNIEYQPSYAFMDDSRPARLAARYLAKKVTLATGRTPDWLARITAGSLDRRDYDALWRRILKRRPSSAKSIPGAFVDWDNTPRRGSRGSVAVGADPRKFGTYFRKQVTRARDVYDKDMIFLFAWNEWAESGYLEPDTRFGRAYLEAVRDSLLELGEFPESCAHRGPG